MVKYMDSDERYCATCKHGNIKDTCSKCEDEYETRFGKLRSLSEIIKSGHGAVDKTGCIVDIRLNPEATPLPIK